jgi:hypothetical protein
VAGGPTGPDGARIPSPIVVCRACGHEEREGSIMRFGTPDEDEDDAVRTARIARWRAEAMVQKWYRDALLLRAVTFPPYPAVDRPAQISVSRDENDDLGHQQRRRPVRTARTRCPQLVATDRQEPDENHHAAIGPRDPTSRVNYEGRATTPPHCPIPYERSGLARLPAAERQAAA